MKRFFRLSSIFLLVYSFLFAGLVACSSSSQTSSNSFSGSKYKNKNNEKYVVSFVNKTEWKFFNDGMETGKGTYKVDGKIISLSIQGEIRADTWTLSGTLDFRIVDKNTIEEVGAFSTGIWKKI